MLMRNHIQTRIVKPPKIPYQTGSSTRVGWQTRSNSPRIFCHGCYLKDDHILPECKHYITEQNFIISSYEDLKADEKDRFPYKYNPATKTLAKGTPEHTLAQEVKEKSQPKNEQGICRHYQIRYE